MHLKNVKVRNWIVFFFASNAPKKLSKLKPVITQVYYHPTENSHTGEKIKRRLNQKPDPGGPKAERLKTKESELKSRSTETTVYGGAVLDCMNLISISINYK